MLEQARRCPSFRDMCEELAAAEEALARMDGLPPSLQAERRGECQGWIERLTLEIDEALTKSKVIPLQPLRSQR